MDVKVRVVMGVMGLLCSGLTACSSQTETAPGTLQTLSPTSGAATRTLSPEGPVATVTPTPLTSPQAATPDPTPSPTTSSSVTATEESDKDSRTAVSPKPKRSKKPKPASTCDPNYSGACVPIVSWDLDCADIAEPVTVTGSDIHRFDADGDGAGCESY